MIEYTFYMQLRDLLDRIPGYNAWRFRQLGGSSQYWERRYSTGENSGDGSYGASAQHKAKVLNAFVRDHDIQSVVEFGCGDGNQLALAEYPAYTGLDIAPSSIQICSKRFAGDRSKTFVLYRPQQWNGDVAADLSMSLDVLYHLVEDDVYHTYLRHLFGASRKYVSIYSSNENQLPSTPHVKLRRFSDDVAQLIPEFRLTHVVESPAAGFCPFYFYERAHGDSI